MKYIQFLGIIMISALGGVLWWALYHHIIIIRFPHSYQSNNRPLESIGAKKKASLYYWQQNKWHAEEIDILLLDQIEQTMHYMLNAWLALLDEEKIMSKKVSVQSVILANQGQEAYISFDRNPFDKKNSAYEKLLLIEGLLKTLRENDIKIQRIHFLLHHQPLVDYHLDFSHPWPLEGFLN